MVFVITVWKFEAIFLSAITNIYLESMITIFLCYKNHFT